MERRHALLQPAPLLLLLFGVVAVSLYGPSMTGEFLNWDDPEYILENPELEGPILPAVGRIFATTRHSNYNPMQRLCYLVLWRAFDQDPMFFRGVSLLLHVIAAFLLYQIGRRWTGRDGPALLAAALFLVHPANVENVAWISELKTLLAAVFGFGAVCVWISGEGSRRAWAGAFGLFTLALLSKTSLVGLPLLLPILDRAAGRRRPMATYVPFLALSLVAGVVQIFAAAGDGAVAPLHGGSIPTHVATVLAVLPRFVLGMILPFGNAPIHVFEPVRELSDLRWLIGVAMLIAGAGAAWATRGRKFRLLVGMLWFFIVIGPTIIFPIPILYADRYLYLAMPFLLLAVADLALPATGRVRKPAIAAALIVIALFGQATFRYQSAWRTGLTLWERGVAVVPESKMAWFYLANERAQIFDQAGSLRAWRRITEIDPEDETAWHYYALGEASLGQTGKAEKIMRQSVQRHPESPIGWANLAVVLTRAGQPEAAREALEEGLIHCPGDPLLIERLEQQRIPGPSRR